MNGVAKWKIGLLFFLQYAVWGALLLQLGMYLSSVGLGTHIGYFFAVHGVVSLFMPALMGYVADHFIKPRRLFVICHLLSLLFMWLMARRLALGEYGFEPLIWLYALSSTFFMPTVALANSLSLAYLKGMGLAAEIFFPRLRTWGTLGFICAMWTVNFLHIQTSHLQFYLRVGIGVAVALYALLLPEPSVEMGERHRVKRGLDALELLKNRELLFFLLFAMCGGMFLQISNSYPSSFIESFAVTEEYRQSLIVRNSVFLLSLSQIAEVGFMLLLPFCIRRLGLKRVIMLAFVAWGVRFGTLGYANPGAGSLLFILSMLVYGVAFDFMNIAGSLYVNSCVPQSMASSGQGLMVVMVNGVGSSAGMLLAQRMVNAFTSTVEVGGRYYTLGDWNGVWTLFASMAAVVALLFWLFCKTGKLTGINDK